MADELARALVDALRASGRALASTELAARLRRARPDVEAQLEALRGDRAVVVCEFPVADPHFGLERVLVAAWVGDGDDVARLAAEERCRHVYDEMLRDFLALHRCV